MHTLRGLEPLSYFIAPRGDGMRVMGGESGGFSIREDAIRRSIETGRMPMQKKKCFHPSARNAWMEAD
jgi:hypothetical protein